MQKIHRDEQVEQQVVQGEDDGEHAEVDGEPVRAARAQRDHEPDGRPPICRFSILSITRRELAKDNGTSLNEQILFLDL